MKNINSIKQILNQLRAGGLSASELCRKCLHRMKKLEHMNAVITVTEDLALQQAQAVDRRLITGNPLRSLEGVPIAVKDNFCTKHIRTTCASNMLRDFHPPYDATVVQKMQDEGAVMLGKLNMDEFAMGSGTVDGIFGPVRNPWQYSKPDDLVNDQNGDSPSWHIAGGSSGGSAVAVATGMAYAALGSDTGGSTRVPASYCGVTALKPSYGRLSRHGLIPLVNTLDVPGIITRSVDDCAAVFNVLSGHDQLDSTTVSDPCSPVSVPDEPQVSGLRIGIPNEYHAPGLSSDVLHAWDRVAGLLSDRGCRVEPVSLPTTQHSIACYSVLCACEVASNMARYDGIEYGHRGTNETSTEDLYAATRHHGFNHVVRGRILAGNYFLLKSNYDKYFLQAQRVRRLITQEFASVFASGVDVILAPVVLSDAPSYHEFTRLDNRTQCENQDVFSQPVNLAGLPAMSIPVCLSSRGLPIGLQLIGPMYSEQSLFTVAAWLEKRLQFEMLDLSWVDDIDSANANSV